MDDVGGLKTAVETLQPGIQSVPVAGAAVQPDLLCEVGAGQTAAENGSPAPRGKGRPPGSANKSTKEWVQFFLARHESPLMQLGRYAAMPLHELARELGVKYPEHMAFDKALDILKVQVGCMNAILPYVHQKMPTAIEAGESGLIQLVINSSAGPQVENAPPPALEIIDMDIEQNQQVTDSGLQNSVMSHSVESNIVEQNQGDSHE